MEQSEKKEASKRHEESRGFDSLSTSTKAKETFWQKIEKFFQHIFQRIKVYLQRMRSAKKNLLHQTSFLQDNMEKSQLPTQSFHSVSCAWGLRNTTNIHKALAEMYRCLKFGGKIIVLEFAPKPIPPIRTIYKTWCNTILPKLGKHIAHSEESYIYLAESIQNFITPQELNAAIQNAGFSHCSLQSLGAGIAALHKGWKL